jgi:hypothetical protein
MTMSQEKASVTSNAAAHGRPIGSARDFVLACIGLVSLLAEGIPTLVERSVQRGSAIVERAQVEAKQQRTAPQAKVAPQALDEWQSQLARLGLPSHRDFETLLQQVNDLEKQIDEIAAQRAARA